jgi:drug/metabolite transporter (DMT)-like permease
MFEKIRAFKFEKNTAGILLMLLHAFSMAALYITAKDLTYFLHPNQVAFLYKFSILVAILPWCMIGGFRKNLKTTKIGLHVTRGTFSVMANLCFFYALRSINVTDAAAITYLEHIIVISIGILYFKEQLTKTKIFLLITGFTGAIFITKPGFNNFSFNYFFIFLALIFWAINNLSIKILGKTERGKAQLFYTMLIGSIFSLPLAIQNWQPIKFEYIKYIVLLALFHLIHVISFFKAFKFSDISAVMPLDYSRLIFTGILGYIFLQEVPDKYSILGCVLIMLGGFLSIKNEARKNIRLKREGKI